MPFDMGALGDYIKSASEHLQHAIATGDQEKADRMHGLLGRANDIAEKQINFQQTQAKALPGLGSQEPTQVMPREQGASENEHVPYQGSSFFDTSGGAYKTAQGSPNYPMANRPPAYTPSSAEGPNPWNQPVLGGQERAPFQGNFSLSDLPETSKWMTMPGVPLLAKGIQAGLQSGGNALSSLINETPLSNSSAEKVAGSQENARMISQRGNPEQAKPTPPTPSTPQTNQGANVMPGENPESHEGVVNDPRKFADDVMNTAKKTGNHDEADRISRYRQILEQKPKLFTAENLMSFLLAGAPKTMQNYHNEVNQWQQWMGKESELAQHYGAQGQMMQQSRADLNAERVHKMQMDEANMVFNQLDRQGKERAEPLLQEMHQHVTAITNLHQGFNMTTIPNAAQQVTAHETRLQQLNNELKALRGYKMPTSSPMQMPR